MAELFSFSLVPHGFIATVVMIIIRRSLNNGWTEYYKRKATLGGNISGRMFWILRRCCPSWYSRTLVVDLTWMRLRCIMTEISWRAALIAAASILVSIILVARSSSSSSHLLLAQHTKGYTGCMLDLRWRYSVSVYVWSIVIPSIYSRGRSCRIYILDVF